MRARTIGVGLIGVAWVAGCHWLMTRAPDSSWSAVVVIGPLLALLALHAGRRGMYLLTVAALAALAGLLLQGWRGGGVAPTTLYMLQHAGIHVALATIFALTLRPGHEPLVTALARRVHGGLTPAMVVYSRKVTILWAAYFTAMATLSVALHVLLPFDAWAVFANLVTPVAMVVLFVGEYLFRYWLHPEFERATLAEAINAYSARGAAPVDRAP